MQLLFNFMNKKLCFNTLILCALVMFALNGAAQLSVGTRVQSLQINTNNGVVSYGSNVISTVMWTNAVTHSNSVTIAAGSTVTNDGSEVLSNATVRGSIAYTPTYKVFTSVTNNDVTIGDSSLMIVTNSVGAVVTGFAAGRDGQMLTVLNMTSSNITFADANASSVINNRLDMLGTGTTNFTAKGSASFIYQNFTSNWVFRGIVY